MVDHDLEQVNGSRLDPVTVCALQQIAYVHTIHNNTETLVDLNITLSTTCGIVLKSMGKCNIPFISQHVIVIC